MESEPVLAHKAETPSILSRLEDKRIFSIELFEDGFMICEQCDAYFWVKLTREELLQLAAEILEVANTKESSGS